MYQPYVVILSAVVSGAILLWFRHLPCESTTEETLQRALDREFFPRGNSVVETNVAANAGN
jgi:hypothetical protein